MGEMRSAYNILVKNHSEDLGIYGKILERILGKWNASVYTGFIWLSIGTSDGLSWTRWWNFGSHKMRRFFL